MTFIYMTMRRYISARVAVAVAKRLKVSATCFNNYMFVVCK